MTEFEALLMETCKLLRQHGTLLEDDSVRDAHTEQIARLEDLLDDAEPVAGSHRVQLRPHARVVLLSGLGAGLARLRQAAEERRCPARAALTVQHERVLRWRDEALTDLLRDGRA